MKPNKTSTQSSTAGIGFPSWTNQFEPKEPKYFAPEIGSEGITNEAKQRAANYMNLKSSRCNPEGQRKQEFVCKPAPFAHPFDDEQAESIGIHTNEEIANNSNLIMDDEQSEFDYEVGFEVLQKRVERQDKLIGVLLTKLVKTKEFETNLKQLIYNLTKS